MKEIIWINFLDEKINISNADAIKGISFELKKEVNNLFGLLAAEVSGKPHLSLIISDNLVKEKNYDASKIIRELRSEEHTSELQSLTNLVCRLLLEKKQTQQ